MQGKATDNKPLRGRRKFLFDLQEASKRCAEGWVVQSLRLEDLRNGEDEGSILCDILHASSNTHVMTLSILVSDTSEYPNEHSFFCCVISQGEVAPEIVGILEAVPEEGHQSIDALLQKLLASCARQLYRDTANLHGGESSEEYDDQDGSLQDSDASDADMYDYQDDDEYYGIAPGTTKSGVDTSALRRDFNEIVANDYRPGLVRVGSSEVAISVSKPTFMLADSIPPQALSAWDPRLLSSVKHLTLIITGIRGVYPVLEPDGTLNRLLNGITFRVGLTPEYKPDPEFVKLLSRTFVHQEEKIEDARPVVTDDMDELEDEQDGFNNVEDIDVEMTPEEEDNEPPEESFSFSLSSSLEALMNDRFLEFLQFRLRYGFGWAAAEALANEIHRTQRKAEDIYTQHIQDLMRADKEEAQLAYTNRLPEDPLQATDRGVHLNLPLCAFSYLLRRLTLCTRYCLVCYNKLQTDFQALKPYVCDNKLCTYQYYNLNRGPSLEYEICSKPETVDLLVSLAYSAASLHSLNGFPDGLELQVPNPMNPNTLVDFDTLPPASKDAAIMTLLNKLPTVADMKRQLEKKQKAGARGLSLREMNPDVPPASWQLLRWCVASCTAQLEELTSPEDRIIGINYTWRQYRFTVGAPDAEAKFRAAQASAQLQDRNAQRYPSLYAFHGSSTKNWHSIIRHGLWYKEVANGRAYGDGVYFAKDGNVSISSYSRSAGNIWLKSGIQVSTCVVLAEIVNLPQQFRASAPFFVVPQTEWILCRYLLVKGLNSPDEPMISSNATQVPIIELDPMHPPVLGGKPIAIPNPTHRLEKLLTERHREFIEGEYDEEDSQVFLGQEQDVDSADIPDVPSISTAPAPQERPIDDWVHDPTWVQDCVEHTLPPPSDAGRMATSSLQRELTRMIKEQDEAKTLKELGWYLPPDFIGDNLFHWIVELHSFDPTLPIARDMVARGVNSIVFEILFPPSYPHAPPFFRILKPRFLPFSHGGGGHVTGGGSMCMDLLTADGWLPSYSISAILLQIKLAISNLDPRPARLANNWHRAYTMFEAIEGYKRAANAHGWKIPQEIDKLAAGSWR